MLVGEQKNFMVFIS